MKIQVRSAMILVTVLAMMAAYLGGALVSAQTSPAPVGPQAPTLTNRQWAALEVASVLLLSDDGDGETVVYLPLVLKR